MTAAIRKSTHHGARRAVRNALRIFIGIGLAIVAAEIALRVWNALHHPPIYQLDARLGWTHVACVSRIQGDEDGRSIDFATDARGLRATTHPDARTEGRLRVLVVGDSFTEASQVTEDELFTSLVERELGDTEVFNVGVGGYGTVQELLALDKQLASFSPDLVVLVVYENDFEDKPDAVFRRTRPSASLRSPRRHAPPGR